MRQGKNPYKGRVKKFAPQKVTVILITCIPHFEGYFKGSLDVLKLCLGSLWKNTDLPFDLMVVDNGSTEKVTRYLLHLKDKNLIQYLILNSTNIGVFNAYNIAFPSAQGEYIAYSDQDCFYYPGWLSKHLEVFETFPNVGSVSGKYVSGGHHIENTLKTIKSNPWKTERFTVPKDWNEEWAKGLGDDPEEFLKRPDVLNCQTYLVEKDGVKVFPGGCGFQFMTRRKVIQRFLPLQYPSFVGGGDSLLHKMIDEAGYLRLTTFEKCTMHMGNSITEDWIQEAMKYGISVEDVHFIHKPQIQIGKPWYVKNKFVMRTLNRIYDKIFKMLYT